MELKLKLTGTRPMLQHNGRLANPVDPYTMKLKNLVGKRKKTDDDLVDIMRTEARGSCWETPEGLMGVPNAAVWRCLYDAAKAFKLGEDIKRSLSFEDTTVPLLIGGEKVACDDYLQRDGAVDYRPVKVMGKKPMRARPRINGWQSEHTFDLLTDVMNARDLEPILHRAGRLVGLGDWRPIYGTFEVEVLS